MREKPKKRKMDVDAKKKKMDVDAKKRKMDVDAKKKMDENAKTTKSEIRLYPREKLVIASENTYLWKSNGGEYEDPTPNELEIIHPFICNYNFEAEDYEEEEWLRSLGEELECPNIRQVLLEFLHQVRESKGYDVTHDVGYFGSPFIPVKLPATSKDDRWKVEEGKRAFIREVNTQIKKSGKRYEVLSVDKIVRVEDLNTSLFTLTVKEVVVDSGDETVKTVRAMVYTGFPWKLSEWNFKSKKEVEGPSEFVNGNFSKMDVDEKEKKKKMDENAKEKKSEIKHMLYPREELAFDSENTKLWKSNGGKYEDPTPYERRMIRRYIFNYEFEAEDYEEDEWLRSLGEEHECPDMHKVLLEFLHQVRESKGYDVNYLVGFCIFGDRFLEVDLQQPSDDESWKIEEGKAAFLRGINDQNHMKESGKRYEIITVDKLVTVLRSSLFNLTVKEVDVDSGEETVKTVRAMVYCSFKEEFPMELLEWKFM